MRSFHSWIHAAENCNETAMDFRAELRYNEKKNGVNDMNERNDKPDVNRELEAAVDTITAHEMHSTRNSHKVWLRNYLRAVIGRFFAIGFDAGWDNAKAYYADHIDQLAKLTPDERQAIKQQAMFDENA
jgi:hypothetical protein